MNETFIHEEVISKSGSYRRVKRWYKGIYPDKGTILRGFTGWETLVEIDVIIPHFTIFVAEKEN